MKIYLITVVIAIAIMIIIVIYFKIKIAVIKKDNKSKQKVEYEKANELQGKIAKGEQALSKKPDSVAFGNAIDFLHKHATKNNDNTQTYNSRPSNRKRR